MEGRIWPQKLVPFSATSVGLGSEVEAVSIMPSKRDKRILFSPRSEAAYLWKRCERSNVPNIQFDRIDSRQVRIGRFVVGVLGDANPLVFGECIERASELTEPLT